MRCFSDAILIPFDTSFLDIYKSENKNREVGEGGKEKNLKRHSQGKYIYTIMIGKKMEKPNRKNVKEKLN
jgi:hypothetical protein